jgi:hypothetical protein
MRSQVLIVATKRIAHELAPWAFYIRKVSTGWKAIHVNKREYTDLLKFGENVRNELL